MSKKILQTVEFDSEYFGDKLSKWIKSHNLSMNEFARQTGLSVATISRISNGKTPDVVSLYLVCYQIGVPMEHFFRAVSPKRIIKQIKKKS